MFSKTALASLLLGVLYANALTIPVAREPAPEPEYAQTSDGLLSREAELETQELDARVLPLLKVAGGLSVTGAALGGAFGLASQLVRPKTKREILDDLLSREAEPENQELDARVLPVLAATLVGAPMAATAVGGGLGVLAGKAINRSRNKRESLDYLLSRGVQDWAQ